MENICPSLSASDGREQQSCVCLGDPRPVTWPNAAPQNLFMLIQNNRTEVEQLTYVKENLT